LTHRLWALAAVDAGRFDEAQMHIQRALAAVPGDTRVAEDLVSRLEKAGRKDQADDVFRRVYQVYAETVAAFPQCALVHNNLAWTAARCGRRLDEALEHAQRAVELAPDTASYLDTLAEVCFRRGDRDAAVGHSRRAVQLRPDDETLQAQLNRFQHDPLP
jgi:Flp pilus assembly protein TadD